MQLATEVSFCHGICPVEITVQLHSHVADREARGRITLLCFGSGLGKLLRQLLFVACNAVSSYSTANSLLPPSRPQRGWKKEKLLHLLTILIHVSIEGGSFQSCLFKVCAFKDASVDPFTQHRARYYPALCQHSSSNSNRL